MEFLLNLLPLKTIVAMLYSRWIHYGLPAWTTGWYLVDGAMTNENILYSHTVDDLADILFFKEGVVGHILYV